MSLQPSATRFDDPGLRDIFTESARWQSWLDVEAALAEAQAALGMVPQASARRIRDCARIELLDDARIREGLARTGHPLVPLVWELARVCGDEAGGHVHWGATTQNVMDTGDSLLLSRAHGILLGQIATLLEHLASQAERSAEMAMAGRTHGQHAVPITFGYKVAVWMDELLRHLERLRALEGRVLVAMMGGAAGTFASMGEEGPAVQAGVAERLGLVSAPVPSRTHRDREAEYVCTLALVAGTCAKIANEIYTLMKQEFEEAREPVPAGTVGSSTMPHKRNPILAQDVVAGAAQVRSLVPLALEAMVTEHEADRTTSVMMRAAIGPACVHLGDCLGRVIAIASGLELDPERMRRNLELTGGMILSESVMLSLGHSLGRQVAHDVVYEATESVLSGEQTFAGALAGDARIRSHLSRESMDALTDPAAYTGLCARMAREQAERARQAVGGLGQLRER